MMRTLVRVVGFAVVAAVVVAGGLLAVAALGQREPAPAPVAAPPTPSASPQLTAVTPTTGPLLPVHAYFPRAGLPPTDGSVMVVGQPPDRPEGRILQRLGALQHNVRPSDIPAGATNPFALVMGRSEVTSVGSTRTAFGISARVDGDLATLEFDVGGWGVADVEQARTLVQQLVYTITDEPGIRRARVIERGKDHALILAGGAGAGYSWKDPLTREDVFGYAHAASTKPFRAAGEQATVKLSTSFSVDAAGPGLLRFVIAVDGLPRQHYPDFTLNAYGSGTQMPNAKAELEITIPGGEDVTTIARTIDRTPLRSIAVGKANTFRAQVYRLGLDDLRPWRAVVVFDPTRIVIDVGGPPFGLSDDDQMAVYAPVANNEVARTFHLTGVARAFEADFRWRVRDARGAVLITGVGKANIGTSPVWGGYDLEVPLPAAAAGGLTLEVFQLSPRDGAETSLVKVPIRVRP